MTKSETQSTRKFHQQNQTQTKQYANFALSDAEAHLGVEVVGYHGLGHHGKIAAEHARNVVWRVHLFLPVEVLPILRIRTEIEASEARRHGHGPDKWCVEDKAFCMSMGDGRDGSPRSGEVKEKRSQSQRTCMSIAAAWAWSGVKSPRGGR